jgi:hypothetical protein
MRSTDTRTFASLPESTRGARLSITFTITRPRFGRRSDFYIAAFITAFTDVCEENTNRLTLESFQPSNY